MVYAKLHSEGIYVLPPLDSEPGDLEGAFGGKRMLAVEDLWSDGFFVRTPFAVWQVEDAPQLSDNRHAAEDPYRARSYWRFAEPETFYALAA